MPKFCGQCGTQVNDNATFCTNCGAPMGEIPTTNGTAQPKDIYAQSDFSRENAVASAQPDYTNSMNNIQYGYGSGAVNWKDKLNKQTLVVLGAGVVALVLVIVLLTSLFGGGYKAPLKTMMKVIEDGEGDDFRKLIPKSQVEALEKIYDALGDKDDVDDYFDETAEDIHDRIVDQYGKKFKVSYEVTDKEKLDKDELEEIEESMSTIGDVDIDAGYKLDVTLSIKYDDGKDVNETEMVVVKIDGDWYPQDASFN